MTERGSASAPGGGTQEAVPPQAWRLFGASVMGTSHVASHLPCQDSHGKVRLANGVLVVAVADGAGSAARSKEGSECAVASSIGYITARLSEGVPADIGACHALLAQALKAARAGLEARAGEEPLGALATTLLLVLVTDRWLAALQIGDGGIVCRQRDGSLHVVGGSGHEEFVNETTFLTSHGYEAELQVSEHPSGDVTGIAVFSDGIQGVALRAGDNQAYAPFFDSIFAFALDPASTQEELQQFLQSERLNERTDDDKTLVIAARHVPD